MGIGAISSANTMSVMQLPSANLKDQKSKNIQTEITDIQQQIRKLSADSELSVSEKANEKKKLQKEKSSLDTELKQHQEALLRSQKREIRLAELREEQNPLKGEDTDENQPLQPGTVISRSSDGTVILKEVLNQPEKEESAVQSDPAAESREEADTWQTKSSDADTNTDPASEFRPSAKEMQAMVSADSSMEIAGRQGTLAAKTNDGIAILKGEMKQDALRGTNTERKQAELKEMQEQRKRELAAQFSMLGEAGRTMQTALDPDESAMAAQIGTDRNFQVAIA